MAKGVLQLRDAVAEELVLDRPLQRRAGGDRPGGQRVDVGDVHGDRHRRAAERRRADVADLGELVGEHEARRADRQLRVADAAVGLVEAQRHGRPEGARIELERARGVAEREVRGGVGLVGGDGSLHRHGPCLAARGRVLEGIFRRAKAG